VDDHDQPAHQLNSYANAAIQGVVDILATVSQLGRAAPQQPFQPASVLLHL
jgi:hypothetical protein